MAIEMLSILSLLPIIAVALFLVVLRWPASRAMPICYLVAVGLALFVWKVPGLRVAAASVNGLVIAGKLLYIIFGGDSALEHVAGERRTASHSKGLYGHYAGPADSSDPYRLAVRRAYGSGGRVRHTCGDLRAAAKGRIGLYIEGHPAAKSAELCVREVLIQRLGEPEEKTSTSAQN